VEQHNRPLGVPRRQLTQMTVRVQERSQHGVTPPQRSGREEPAAWLRPPSPLPVPRGRNVSWDSRSVRRTFPLRHLPVPVDSATTGPGLRPSRAWLVGC
jgi:hypothetical protein